MKNGFLKVAAGIPKIRVADCSANLEEHLRIYKNARAQGVKLLVFPELSICGCTCGDLFLSSSLLGSAYNAILSYCKSSTDSDIISIIGFPLLVNNKLYNSAVICQKGHILAVVPKENLQNNSTFFESRYFSAYSGECIDIRLGEDIVPFGTKQIFSCAEAPIFSFGVEIGSDLFSISSPSLSLASEGALIIANPHASAQYIGAEERRRLFVTSQAERLAAGYILSGSGDGESTTDLVFGGHSIICESGKILSEAPAFKEFDGLLVSELDAELLSHERRSRTGGMAPLGYRKINFSLNIADTTLTRKYSASPFMPEEAEERFKRCGEILKIQATALAKRMERAHADKLVIGISGGLDSTLALLVSAEACDLLKKPRTSILSITMPCFGTSSRTRTNAEILCSRLGTAFRCINIGDAVKGHFSDIGHDEACRNVVYENAQARERTQVLMDIANMENALVVGTGDLSELVLGFATYNGDHMSMYGVNASVPKTLMRHITAFYADNAETGGNTELAAVLRDILATPVSPELLPADDFGKIAQKTEDIVGPYEIHDFYIYYLLRYGFSPEKLLRLAENALGGKYSKEELIKCLKNLIRRFFTQQFKRSCLPDGPKVCEVGVSPRGGLLMPSDASFAEWMKEIDTL